MSSDSERKTQDVAPADTEHVVAQAAAPLAQAESPNPVPAFAAKATDLEALRNALVDAAGVGAGLWLSYLFLIFYLAVAAGSVTHRDLFLEIPVKLPFLNVELPLVAFFVLGPLLFLIVHAYVLLHFVLLAGKVGAFHAELRKQITNNDAREGLRRQLPSNIFVQFLAGPLEVRTGIMGFMLRVIAWIPLVFGPLALLVFFQLQFLPYHSEPITWWHRLSVAADLALLWTLWPSIARGDTTWVWRDLPRRTVATAVLASLIPSMFVFTIVTFPGEWLDKHVPSISFVPTRWPSLKEKGGSSTLTVELRGSGKSEGATNEAIQRRTDAWTVTTLWKSMEWTSLHKLAFESEVNVVGERSASLWSNVLVVPDIDAIDRLRFDTEAKIAAVPETRLLRGRRLEGAILARADLRKVDLTGAHLQGASLVAAQLKGASLFDAQLQGASFLFAKLEGAQLVRAQLQGAELTSTQLQGAILDGAQLQGATLSGANLVGATLYGASLHGAFLNSAHLQGAGLSRAQLPGASLVLAELQGAVLRGAKLQGALLYKTQLQGALFEDAQLESAFLVDVFVWRADLRKASTEGALVRAAETEPKYQKIDCPTDGVCDWSQESFAVLTRMINEQIPGDFERREALKRIAVLDPATPRLDREISETWHNLSQSQPLPESYVKSLTESLRSTGCGVDGAPYVIHSLLRQFTWRVGADLAAIARAFLDEDHCPGARGLSEQDRAKLRESRDSALPRTSKH